MKAFVGKRLLQFIPVVLLASVAVWGIIYAVPGSPAIAIAGQNATKQQIAAINVRLGLNKPVYVQYWLWLEHAVRGNFGVSTISGQSVTSLLLRSIPATLQLALLAMIFGLILAFPLGLLATLRPRSWLGRGIAAYEAAALAIPTFWFGILLIIFLTIDTHLMPGISNFVPFWQDPAGALRNTALPALTLAVFISGIIARFLTAAMNDVLSRDYIRTARGKGVTERKVVLRHGLRNALLPTVTIVGLQFGVFIGGTVVTESVFNYPGLGRLIYSAVDERNYPVLQGAVLFIVLAFLVINLVVDITYAYLDPRIRKL